MAQSSKATSKTASKSSDSGPGRISRGFWRLLGAVLGIDLQTMDYPARLACLADQRIALWDAIGQGHRQGSLDASIRIIERSDLARLTAMLPNLRALAFNGKLAAGQAAAVSPGLEKLVLPSSSPANTAPFAAKLEAWMTIRRFLDL